LADDHYIEWAIHFFPLSFFCNLLDRLATLCGLGSLTAFFGGKAAKFLALAFDAD
jgi:hypothetical protein